MGKDYIYAIAPLIEDALIDRDAVHRQTACAIVKHVSLGCVGLSCEDALVHILNFVWPNIFETSPHVIKNVFEVRDCARTFSMFLLCASTGFKTRAALVAVLASSCSPPLCVLLAAPCSLLTALFRSSFSPVRRRRRSRAAASHSARV